MTDVRAQAARCLAAVVSGQSLARELPRQEQHVPARERALLRELCYGTLRHYWRYHAILNQTLVQPLKPRDGDVRMLLCAGLYQLEQMRLPAHAAVNATVSACAALKKPWARKLVNAVLRRYQREADTLGAALTPAAASAHPEWLYRAILEAWPEQSADILAANNTRPPMVLRVNRRRHAREDYLQQLDEAGIAATPCVHAADGIRLERAVDVAALPGFEHGAVSVQDESAQLCAPLLRLAPGMRVLDACAAPGGKACHLLEIEPALQLTALDVDDERLERVRGNLDRLKHSASLLAGDATRVEDWWDGESFDALLVDAPCSATGVIRRNPDIKLHRRAADIDGLAQSQRSILAALWPLLKPGGQLLYVTCSVLPAENEVTVEHFLANHPEATLKPIDAQWGAACAHGRQILPNPAGGDGFYFSLMEKH